MWSLHSQLLSFRSLTSSPSLCMPTAGHRPEAGIGAMTVPTCTHKYYNNITDILTSSPSLCIPTVGHRPEAGMGAITVPTCTHRYYNNITDILTSSPSLCIPTVGHRPEAGMGDITVPTCTQSIADRVNYYPFSILQYQPVHTNIIIILQIY